MVDKTDDLILIRDILSRELETINNYQKLLSISQSPEVKEFIAHIIEEEKEHVAEAMELIKSLDPGQAAVFEDGNHWRNTPISSPLDKTDQVLGKKADPNKMIMSFTVGSLKNSQRS